jgi:hypothetical protein
MLFSAPMVRAIQDGSKTQTRRVLKFPPGAGIAECDEHEHWLMGMTECDNEFMYPCPYGQKGDRINVKEAAWMWCERRPNGKTKTGRDKWHYVPLEGAPIYYAADKPRPTTAVTHPNTGNKWGWRLKIGRFLPAWAVRIQLEIASVRVERLNDISEADAIAEGIENNPKLDPAGTCHWRIYGDGGGGTNLPEHSYETLWEQINGAGSWQDNPWVWCVEFRRVGGRS